MSILSSFARYLGARGRLLYTESLGWTSGGKSKRGKRRGKASARSQYMELMEPRVLMTTVLGGESFRYIGADGLPVLATLNGNVIAELVGAVQAGGRKTGPGTAVGGHLVLGDLVGQITSGPRTGTILGNGSLPVTLGNINSASTKIPNINYTSSQINIFALASDVEGRTFAFNAFDTDATGTIVKTANTPNQTIWTFQIVQLNTSTGAASVPVFTVDSTSPSPIPLDAENATIPAAAYNPFDGKFYFEVNYSTPANPTTNTPATFVDQIYSWDRAGNTLTSIGTINTAPAASGAPQLAVKGMTFGFNATSSTTGMLYVMLDSASGNTNANFGPRLASFAVSSTGVFNPAVPLTTFNAFEGFGSARIPLQNVVGLATLPDTFGDGVTNGHIFALVSNGTNGGASHVVRLDLAAENGSINGMKWGNTVDLAQSLVSNDSAAIFDGMSPGGFTYNPAIVDPFTGQLGAWLSIDRNTHNVNPTLGTGDDLIFVNHKLRIDQGDVFTVYSNFADIKSSIVLQGLNASGNSTLYTGNSGALGSTVATHTAPGATGAVFVGFRGILPSNAANLNAYIQNAPFMTAQLTGSIGIIPGQVMDLTDPSNSGLTLQSTQTLVAGLMVPRSLQQTLNPTGALTSNLLGSNARNVSGLAIAPDGKIAIINSNITTPLSRDQLAFVNPTTGAITGGFVNVTLTGSPGTILRNVEGLAYGDFNLSGTSLLYAVYDLGNGNGPTLGTIATTGVFTPVGVMNLGAHGKVTSIAFTPGGTAGDPTHESLYVTADPNYLDNNATQSLYQVNVATGAVLNQPSFDSNGNLVSSGGIGRIVDSGTRGLSIAAAFFDTNGRLLVDDKASGRLLDVNLTTARAGTNYTSAAGLINPTVTGIALDPNTLRYLAVDNITGLAGVGVGTTSSILMALRDLTSDSAQSVSLGKFILDGTFTGRATVFGSMDMFYAGDLLAGDATAGGSWLLPPLVGGGPATLTTALLNNSFINSFYIGGDIRNIVSLTHMGDLVGPLIGGLTPITAMQITVKGKIGAITALGTMSSMVRASNDDNIPGLTDTSHLSLSSLAGLVTASSSLDAYGYTFRGSANATSGFLSLTNGIASQTGSVFGNELQAIDTFHANFTFAAQSTLSGIDGGFAFVLQNQGLPALGGGNGGLGYSGIVHSAALEFVFNSSGSGGTVGLRTNGAIGGTALFNPNIQSGDAIDVDVSYNGTAMIVSITDLTNLVNFTTSFNINLPSIMGGHSAYVGFTGSSGTRGNFTAITGFEFDGAGTRGMEQLAQGEIGTFGINPDYTFAGGFLVNNGANAPFNNNTFATAQYLGSVRNAFTGQSSDVIHVVGTLDGATPTNANPVNNPLDYYAFSLLAGQTVTVSVKPLASGIILNNTLSSLADVTNFAIFDPDGNMVATDFNFADNVLTAAVAQDRTIQFRADRPGTYRIAINNNGDTTFLAGGNSANTGYELTIKGGVGNLALGAINAGGDINLRGLASSILIDSGDVGVIHSGGNISAPFAFSGLVGRVSTSLGAFFAGLSSTDISVPLGNLHSVEGASVGVVATGVPDVNVGGDVGLLSGTGTLLNLTFGHAVGGNIQTINSAGDLEGVYRTNKAIGVIRAGSVSNTSLTEFNVDVDRANHDGVIDLITVTGAWNGASLVTGPGGNVRFMQVGGAVVQDAVFIDSTLTGARGEIVHGAGPVGFLDDSGASMTLTPSSIVNASTTGTVTTTGVITTRSFGVRGGAGSVLIDVSSSTDVSIDLKAGLRGEVGAIIVGAAGAGLNVVNGIPSAGTAGGTTANVVLTSSGGGSLDVYSITGNTLNTVRNDTDGDIVNATATDFGSIIVKGNLGTTTSTTDAALIPLTRPFGAVFPFSSQYAGVIGGNIGQISAGKGIGNVLASGVIGTITANSDNVDEFNVFEGLFGLIVSNGTASGTDVSGGLGTSRLSISAVNIGEGIASQGTATSPRTGIYALGRIGTVRGTNADIRGNIVSVTSIGTVTLTDGSIVHNIIGVFGLANSVATPTTASYALAGIFSTATRFLPSYTTDIDNPSFVLDTINIQGNGGIIGSAIEASNIRNVIVGPAGFGLLNSRIVGVGQGTIANITIGGYGIRRSFISDARVLNISANGSGAEAPLSNFSTRVHTLEHNVINTFEGTTPNVANDIELAIFGDGIVYPFDTYGLTTGVIGLTTVQGEDRLGNVGAYDVKDSSFSFPQGAGTITIRHDADDTQFLAGGITGVSVAHNATNLEVTSAGPIGSVFIGGSFGPGQRAFVTGLSQVIAKGGAGIISNFVAKGPFAGLLLAEGKLGSATFGQAGTANGAASTGDFSGTVTVGGKLVVPQVLDSLKIYGSFVGGILDVTGNTGTIEIAHNLSASTNSIQMRGNVTNFIVGSDPVVNGSSISSPVYISGNLANGVITGKLDSQFVVQGNVAKFTINSDPATVGTDLITSSGALTVGGTLSAMTVQGGIAGNIIAGSINTVTVGRLLGELWGGRGIASATITGGILAGGSVNSALGNILKLVVSGGDINGSITAPNGSLSALTITGSIGVTGNISALAIGAVVVPGAISGTMSASTSFTSLKVGSVTSTGYISSPNLASVTTTGTAGDLNGVMVIGNIATAVKIIVAGSFGGNLTVNSPLTMTVAGSFVSGATLSSTSNLTSLAIKGALAGDILVDGVITTLTAGTVNGAIVTAGMGLTTFTVTGTVSNTLVNVGLSRGNDGIFGTGDVGEQARMADIGAISAASLVNTIITAGGNVTSLKLTANMSSSSLSSGFVLDGGKIVSVGSDLSPLASNAELNAARDAVLLHGNIKSVTIGNGTAAALINSSVTAGVSPGADGAFGTSDDNVNTSITGGASVITAFKGIRDGSSNVLANSSGGSATLVGYTVGTSSSSILSVDPITTGPSATATPLNVATISTASGIITITVTGLGASVRAYDNGATTDRLDTLLISSTTSAPVTVVVHTSSANSFALGRVITTDGTNLANFTFDGDILGDVNGGPSLWIDSDMVSFTIRNLPNDQAWFGQIGGNVTKLTLNQMGPGHLRIGGRVTTLAIGASAGDPLVQQLGSSAAVSQLAFDPSTGNLFATDGSNLLQVDAASGATLSSFAIHSLLGGTPLNVSGISFDASGNLYGIANINNLDPLNLIGSITTTGDDLRGFAVNSSGTLFAIDTFSGVDSLVTFDPFTGAEKIVGTIKDAANDTYSHNILALAFDTNDNLLALTNDRDGSGVTNAPGSGVALGRITVSGNIVRFGNPTSNGLAPVLIAGNPTEDFKGLAVDPTLGTIYAIRRVGSTDELDILTISGTGIGVTVNLASQGVVQINGGTDTNLIGIGVDEAHNLVGLNVTGTSGQLISIDTAAPGSSDLFEVPDLLAHTFAGFAIGRDGANFKSYAYTTNATTGGELFTNVGLTPTLGKIDSAGAFTNLLPAVQDSLNTPLNGNILSIAEDGAGHLFAITDHGILLEYNNADGSLVGGQPLGVVRNASGITLRISRIAFDGNGRLIGINGVGNNLVQIATTTSLVNGQRVVSAISLTDIGTADEADLTALTFFNATGSSFSGKFLSYSLTSGKFVALLGTEPDVLGGMVANSYGAVTLPGGFTSRIAATGNGLLTSIDSIKLTSAGTFSGKVESKGGIGTVVGTGSTFAGTIVSHGDITGITMAGSVASNGIFAADGLIKALTFTGPFNGEIIAGRATTITINGSLGADAIISVVNDVTTFTLNGASAGGIDLGSVKALKISGAMLAGSTLNVAGDAAAVTLSGQQLGSLVSINGGVTTLTIGGTVSGVVAVKKTVGTAVFLNIIGGILDVGQDISTLTVNGVVTNSVLSAGTWIGADGIYNTEDDVIFGGSIGTAKIVGVFTDSLVTAGVLPPQDVPSGVNNIPANFSVYTYNPNALSAQDVDAAESGGIGLSVIKNITFSKPVVSTNVNGGRFSVLVVADGVTKVTATGELQPTIVRNDPPGAPQVALLNGQPDVRLLNSATLQITFDQPLNSPTIGNSTFAVVNADTLEAITDLVFKYFTKVADDGSIHGVVQISSASNFGQAPAVQVTIIGGLTAPTISDRTGLRSALRDFNQDGILDPTGDPFGTTLAGNQQFVVVSTFNSFNDNFVDAVDIVGFPATVFGSNVNATVELLEPATIFSPISHTVWWTWTAPSTGFVQIDTIGSSFDTVLSVYLGNSVSLLSQIAVDDQSGGNNTSLLSFVASFGVTYRIRVDGWFGASGTIILNLS